jgi:hypothetical protein
LAAGASETVKNKQIAFRVKTDAAILGAGIVLAGGTDTYPAPPATPRQHPKLTTPFSPEGTKCNLRFASSRGRDDFRALWFCQVWFTGFLSLSLILNPVSWLQLCPIWFASFCATQNDFSDNG